MEAKSIYPVVCFGEILWDFLPQGKLPGGAPVNVAYHLKMLGKNPSVISRIGEDDEGKELLEVFQSKGIDTSFIQQDPAHQTGKVLVELKDNHEVDYEIVRPVAWDFIEWNPEFISLVTQARYFVFGSLVARNSVSRNTLFQCLENAQTKVLDINLRPPHFEKQILNELLEKADVLKLNLSELHLISGSYHLYHSDEDRIEYLQERFKIETIIVTKGNGGAILYIHDRFFHHAGYPVRVADTVGSGDAFLAAMLSKLMEGSSPNEALAFANALGAYVASCAGGCPNYTVDEVLALKKK